MFYSVNFTRGTILALFALAGGSLNLKVICKGESNGRLSLPLKETTHEERNIHALYGVRIRVNHTGVRTTPCMRLVQQSNYEYRIVLHLPLLICRHFLCVLLLINSFLMLKYNAVSIFPFF